MTTVKSNKLEIVDWKIFALPGKNAFTEKRQNTGSAAEPVFFLKFYAAAPAGHGTQPYGISSVYRRVPELLHISRLRKGDHGLCIRAVGLVQQLPGLIMHGLEQLRIAR